MESREVTCRNASLAIFFLFFRSTAWRAAGDKKEKYVVQNLKKAEEEKAG